MKISCGDYIKLDVKNLV